MRGKRMISKRIVSMILSLSLLVTLLRGAIPVRVFAEDTTSGTTQVLYVDGKGSGEKDGSSAANALANLGEAYKKIPADNVETTIVICGAVNAIDGATDKGSGKYYYPTNGGASNSHEGTVVITSVYGEVGGEEDYSASASLAFSGQYYLLGDTVLRNIKIVSAASYIYMNYNSLHLADGISGKIAGCVYGGTSSTFSGLSTMQDVTITVDSGTVGTIYGGGPSWQGSTARGKNNTVTLNVNGGVITTLVGSGLGGTDNAHHKGVTINMNGGTVTTLYGAGGAATVYNDIAINLNGGTVETLYGANKYTVATGDNASYTPTIYGNVEITVGNTVVTNLYGAADGANVKGNKVLHYQNADNVTIGAGTNFSALKLTSSSVTVPESAQDFWSTVTNLEMTDDSKLTLETVPSAAVTVTAVKAGENWNMADVIITAPAGTAKNSFALESPIDMSLQCTEETDAVTWRLVEVGSNVGQLGTAGEVLNIDLGLPEADEYTVLSEDATPYQVFLQKLEDLGDAKDEVNVISPITVKGQYEIYVSPTGDDTNIGSIDAPLATIGKALDKVAVLQESMTDGVGGIVVYLREGTYTTTDSITLNQAHSGKDGVPVIISAYGDEEVVISGGTKIPGNAFSSVEDEAILNRLQDSVKNQIVKVDLKSLGITEFPTDPIKQMLVVDGEQFTLARYPNGTKLALTGDVVDPGRITVGSSTVGPNGANPNSTGIEFKMTDFRPKTWVNDGNIYLIGSLYAEWEIATLRVTEIRDTTIKLSGSNGYGAKTSSSNTYYYYNILEELDVPGEFYVDKTSGILYLYPIAEMADTTVTYSVMQDNLIHLNGTQNVILNGLIIENGAASGVKMSGCEQTVVQNCIIRNVKTGVIIDGKKSGVIYSDIYNIANKPAEISTTQVSFDYEPECNFLQNCYIYNTGTQNGKLSCITLQGTGNVVSHNLIQGTYASSIYLKAAKECIVEYNEIVGGPSGINDMGAIYMPYSVTATGNHVRYNYIHDIGLFSDSGNPQAIYFDEGSSGHFAYGNIMKNVPRGFFTNSGSENVVVNNVILNGRTGTTSAIAAHDFFGSYTIAERFARSSEIQTECENYMSKSVEEQAAIKGRYPLLAKFFENMQSILDEEGDSYVGYFTSHDNYVANNLIYDCGSSNGVGMGGIDHIIENNTILTAEDGNPFNDVGNHDYSLKSDVTTAFTYQIPSMEKIGVSRTKQGINEFSAYMPVNGSQKQDPTQVLLKWTLAGGADTYTLTLATDDAFTENVKTLVLETPYILFAEDEYFSFDTSYYWKVVANSTAKSRNVTAKESAVMSFKTMTEEEYENANPIDYTELKEVIVEAETFIAEAVEQEEGGLYYDGTKEALQSALNTAKEMVTKGESGEYRYTEEEVAQEVSELNAAVITAKCNRDIRTITFERLDSSDWSNNLVTATVVSTEAGEELQLLYDNTSGSKEVVYGPGLNERDILSFKYKQERRSHWCGFAIAQSNTNVEITSKMTDGYLVCLFGGTNQIELQKYKDGVQTIPEVVDNCDQIIKIGEEQDIEIGAINNADGSVRILFKVDGKVIFDYLDTENAVVGETGFGVIVQCKPRNGALTLSQADLSEGDDSVTDGYTAGLNTSTDEVIVGETVSVNVSVSHSDENETAFAAGEVVLTYDSTKLTFDEEATKDGLGTATVKVLVEDNVGTITLEDFGANKSFEDGVYTLTFKAVADGNATVTMTSAAFIDTEASVKDDLIAATISPATLTLTVNKVAHSVTLPEGFDGETTVTDGEDYTFSVSATDGAYYEYGDVTATVNGNPVEVTNNNDGTYTIASVAGELKISGTRTPKSYDVTLTGTAAEEIEDAADKATYGTDYTFTMPTADGFAYNLESLTIDGVAYMGYTVDTATNVYTIPGSAIKGQIAMNISKTATKAAVTVTGSGAGAAAGYAASAVIGEDYVLTINPENGYTYIVTATMNGTSVEVLENIENNTYTVKNVTGPIAFTVERVINVDGVEVTNYLTVNANNVWLVKNTTTVAEGKVPTYDGKNMFWSEKYDAYCYLVIAETITADEVTSKVGIADGTATNVNYGMDVNMSGKVDASDAQLTYNIYNAMYAAFTEDVTMEKFLRADVNYDGEVNTTDAVAIITHILGNN